MPATYTELMDRFRRTLSISTCGGQNPALILVSPKMHRAILHDRGPEWGQNHERALIEIGLVGHWNFIPVLRTAIPFSNPDWSNSDWRFL